MNRRTLVFAVTVTFASLIIFFQFNSFFVDQQQHQQQHQQRHEKQTRLQQQKQKIENPFQNMLALRDQVLQQQKPAEKQQQQQQQHLWFNLGGNLSDPNRISPWGRGVADAAAVKRIAASKNTSAADSERDHVPHQFFCLVFKCCNLYSFNVSADCRCDPLNHGGLCADDDGASRCISGRCRRREFLAFPKTSSRIFFRVSDLTSSFCLVSSSDSQSHSSSHAHFHSSSSSSSLSSSALRHNKEFIAHQLGQLEGRNKSTATFRCRSNRPALPPNPWRMPPRQEHKLARFQSWRQRVSVFCTVEPWLGLTNIQLQLAACLALAWELGATKNVVINTYVDHKKPSANREFFEDVFDFARLVSTAARYNIRVVQSDEKKQTYSLVEQQLARRDFCLKNLWFGTLSQMFSCCLVDAGWLALPCTGFEGRTMASFSEKMTHQVNNGSSSQRPMSLHCAGEIRRQLSTFFQRSLPKKLSMNWFLGVPAEERWWNETNRNDNNNNGNINNNDNDNNDENNNADANRDARRDKKQIPFYLSQEAERWAHCRRKLNDNENPRPLGRRKRDFVSGEKHQHQQLWLRVSGLNFAGFNEFRSATWLPTLDWLQPSPRIIALSQIVREKMRRKSEKFFFAPKKRMMTRQTTAAAGEKILLKEPFKYLAIHYRTEFDAAITWNVRKDASILHRAEQLAQQLFDGGGAESSSSSAFSSSSFSAVFVTGAPFELDRAAEQQQQQQQQNETANRHHWMPSWLSRVSTRLWFSGEDFARFDQLSDSSDGDERIDDPKPLPPIAKQALDRLVCEEADVALVWDPFRGFSSFSQSIYDSRCRRAQPARRTFSYSQGRDETAFVLEC